MTGLEQFRVLSTAEYNRLSVEEKLRYLEQAFRHACAMDVALDVPPEVAAQNAAAESQH